MTSHDPNQAKRVELILHQLEALPTLSTVAVHLLELTTASDVDTQQVIDLVAADPALASKVIKLCRCHPRGRTSTISSLDRAVLLLGFDALREALGDDRSAGVLGDDRRAGPSQGGGSTGSSVLPSGR